MNTESLIVTVVLLMATKAVLAHRAEDASVMILSTVTWTPANQGFLKLVMGCSYGNWFDRTQMHSNTKLGGNKSMVFAALSIPNKDQPATA